MAGSEIIVSSDIINSTSELWVLKVLSWFRKFDVDCKGYFIKEEVDKMFGERVMTYVAEDEVETIAEVFKDTWDQTCAAIAVSHGGRTVVTWYDYLEYFHENVRNHAFINKTLSILRKQFPLADKNNDGIMSTEEFSRMLKIYGCNERDSMIAMAVQDKECKGGVSVDGYIKNWVDYFYTFDWNESTMALGYLANVKIRKSNTFSIRWHVDVPRTILQEMGELWVRKLLTFFRHFDIEGTGVIDWDGMVRLAKKRTENKAAPGQIEGIIAFGKIFWDMIWAPVASQNESRTTIKWADFIQSRYEAATQNRSVDEKLLGDFHAKAFEVIDANHDSSIQLEEYLFLTAVRGLTRHQAVVSFANIDINADGTISYTESLEAWRCFLYSKEWGSGTLLYGTLDNAKVN